MWSLPGSTWPRQRTQLLGSSAWAQRAVVSWRLAGDDTDVEHQIWLTFLSDGGQVKLAGTVDEPPNSTREQMPSWWLGPFTATERGGVTVVAGSGQALDRWARLAAAALDNVRDSLPGRSAAFVERSGSDGSASHAARL